MSWEFTDVSESGVKPGDYECSIAEAELKNTKTGTGQYIKVKLESSTGEVFYHNFNVKNDNAKAVQIGMGQLKKLLRVSGKADPNKLSDPSELIGLRCIAKVGVRPAQGSYPEQAEIKDFKEAPKVDPFL